MVSFTKNRNFRKIIFALILLVPFILVLKTVLSGNIDLWYDNARDLLMALDNQRKLTLIGQPTGIPGLFYPPYWIWILSIGLFFSKDPKIVTLLVAALPYLIIFPLIWFRFSKIFGWPAILILWILFIFGIGSTYATELWNPYPAPLFTLAALYLLVTHNSKKLTWVNSLLLVLTGIMLGIVTSLQFSFGIAFTAGVFLFLFWDIFTNTNHLKIKILSFCFILLGFLITFFPFFLFEARHGFHQTQAVFHTLTRYGDVVAQKGLSKSQLFLEFVKTYGKVIHMHFAVAGIVLIALVGNFFISIKKGALILNKQEKRLGMLLFSIIISVALIYFFARNPIWDYHFIGFDIILMVLSGFLLHRTPFILKGFIIWAAFIFLWVSYYSITHTGSSILDVKKDIVKTISADAGSSDYVVFTYSPSIYTYEYSYLFQWITEKNIPYDPARNPQFSKLIYFIIPEKMTAEVQDFLNYRSPASQYKTEKSWTKSGTVILKRSKNNLQQ